MHQWKTLLRFRRHIGITTKYSYDLYGKLLTVTDSRDRTTTMTYDVVNRLATKTLPNGVKTTYTYDDLDRFAKIVYTKADGSVLASETYTRNAGGEPSKVLREDGTYTLYDYDAANRLSKEVAYSAVGVALKSIVYTYDLDGKRIRKVDRLVAQDYTYNANGQLVTAGQNGYVYDVDGRLSQVTKAGGAVSLAHDAFDRLTQVTNNGVTTQYLYDAQGDRIGEVSGSNTKNYLVAPNISNGLSSTDLVTDGNGSVVSDYVYGGSSIIARLDANGNPIYYLTDAMGSVIGLVDDQGNILSRIIYDGFGNVESGDDGSSQGGDFRFQSQWLESESGLYYMRARDYDAETGLFLSRDAVDVQQQEIEAFNPYQFAYNNPLVFKDPTGMITMTELNTSLEIQKILTSTQSFVARQAYQYIIDQSKGIAGNLLTSALKSLIPGGWAGEYIGKYFDNGTLAETFIKDQICGFFGGKNGSSSLANRLWFNSEIKTSGVPNRDGFNCDNPNGEFFINSPSIPNPDFIYKQGSVVDRDGKPKAWLIGDVKGSLRELHNKVVLKPKGQWEAIHNYAAYKNEHQFVPLTLFVVFRPGTGTSKQITAMELELAKEALSKSVIINLIKTY
jgi:RHS repeat-associated protein